MLSINLLSVSLPGNLIKIHFEWNLFLFRITNRFILPSTSSSNSDTIDLNDKANSNTPTREFDALLEVLLKRSDGVEIAHEHAKHLSRYMFALIHYVQERSIEELEHAERTSKLATNSSLSSFLNTYRFLPGIDLMSKNIEERCNLSFENSIDLDGFTNTWICWSKALQGEQNFKKIYFWLL